LVAWPVSASDRKAPPLEPAGNFADCERHDSEKISIAAEPYETDEKLKLFRVNYMEYGFLPVRLIVTNDSDKTLSLDDARIVFVTADGMRVAAADPEDIDRRTTQIGQTGETIPLPFPLPPIRRKPKTKDPKIEEDFKDFEYTAASVGPHSSAAGFLFYDVKGVKEPLVGAHLVLRKLAWSPSGSALYDFEVSFDKYLAAQGKTKR
jgi:hypothetical protein